MDRREYIRRYALFGVAVLVNAFGIAFITKAMLGTSPISSLPYVLSVVTPPTMGQYTIYTNFFFIFLETVIMGRREAAKCKWELLAQVPITLVFGFFIDISMYGLLAWLTPSAYISKVVALLVGCCILAFGISLEVKANVAMVVGEYFVSVIAKRVKGEFGYVKVAFDVTLVILACLLSVVTLGRFEGVREGTLVAALIVGPIAHFIHPHLAWLDSLLVVRSAAAPVVRPAVSPSAGCVITIAREFGSGGHLLGAKLAERLGLRFYDKELIALAAHGDLDEERVRANEQRLSSNKLLNIILRDYGAPIAESLNPADAVFVAQSRVIRQIAARESCIILGRLADYVLKDYPPRRIIRVFCSTTAADALRRCVDEYGRDPQTALGEIERTNSHRVAHYQYYTGRRWGDPHNYDVCVNTAVMPLDAACDIIEKLYKLRVES